MAGIVLDGAGGVVFGGCVCLLLRVEREKSGVVGLQLWGLLWVVDV
jgi:hypothetical protein